MLITRELFFDKFCDLGGMVSDTTLVNVYVDLLVFTRIAGTS